MTAVVLCFNHERFVERALDSVLEQSLRPRRMIITDDASTDSSQRVITSYLSKASGDIKSLLHEANTGLPRMLNEALELVDTEYVAFMSADDWMEPERFALQVDEFERAPESVAAVHSDMFRIDEEGRRIPGTHWKDRKAPQGEVFLDSIYRCPMAAPSVLLRTAVVRELGGYDESLPMEDFDLWMRLTRDHCVSYVDRPLVNYRVVATSMSNVTPLAEFREWHLPSLSKHLDLAGHRGEAVAARMQHLAKMLYFDGRSAELTAATMLQVVRRRPNLESMGLLATALVRIPGPVVAKVYSWLRHCAVTVRSEATLRGRRSR